MKQVIAVVKPFRAQAVLEALDELPVDSVLVFEAKGQGRQKDLLHEYVGSEYNQVHLPKIEIQVFAAAAVAERVVATIVAVGRTGRIGDGKILVLDALLPG